MPNTTTQHEAEALPCELTKRECISFLISLRRSARSSLRHIADITESNRADSRMARKHRKAGDPLLIRAAEVIEARIAARKADLDLWTEVLCLDGMAIRDFSGEFDRMIPRDELLDILSVNRVDRGQLRATDGLWKIVFVHGLEDSATHRGSEWKEGPLFKAMVRYMDHAMKTNPELQRTITDSLFGKGGLFEFVPTYSRTASGEFKRNPPKLRLADETDAPANKASA